MGDLGNSSRVRIARQDGFTVVEVLMAVLVLTVGMIAVIGAFDPARKLGTQAELRQVASAAAEQELQRVQSLPWSKVAMKSEPAVTGAAAPNPTHYISNSPCAQTTGPTTLHCYQWDWTGGMPAEGIVVDTTNGDPTANPTNWTTTVSTSNGAIRLRGSTYRYVTWATDQECTASACGGSGDYKRVTAIVTVNNLRSPVELSSLVTNPAAPAGGSVDPLNDTSVKCNDSGTQVSCIG